MTHVTNVNKSIYTYSIQLHVKAKYLMTKKYTFTRYYHCVTSFCRIPHFSSDHVMFLSSKYISYHA